MSDDKIKALELSFSQDLAFQAADRFSSLIHDCLTPCSPIERLMGIAMIYALQSDEHFRTDGNTNCVKPLGMPGDFESFSHVSDYGFYLHPQFPISKYRADFFISFKGWNGVRCAGVIECDGHDFHERTKHQAAHDKARDRYFQSLGLLVLRFTGSEIYADPLKCAVDALTIFTDASYGKVRA